MKSIYTILKNVKNLLPYFGLIAIYFFFVNIEAKKENKVFYEKNQENLKVKSNNNKPQLRLKIPVIPYEN